MRGRGTRKAPSIKKTAFTMFDFTGVTDFHGDTEEIPADGGFVVTAERKDKDRRTRGLLVLDVNDHIDPSTRGWITLDENGDEQRGPAIDPRAAELGAQFEAWFLAHDEFSPDQRRLLRMVGEVIKANASDLDSFEPYHFANDPFRGVGGKRAAERLFGGAKELAALLAGLNAAVFPADMGPSPGAESPRPTA
jgi:type I restriction enzyme R subunit